MVVIRLARGGATKRPFYHVVVADSRRARGGRYIERIGFLNPVARGQEVYLHLNQERINYWVGQGAQPSERVEKLIKDYSQMGEKTGTLIRPMLDAKVEARKAKAKAKKALVTEAEAKEEQSAEG